MNTELTIVTWGEHWNYLGTKNNKMCYKMAKNLLLYGTGTLLLYDIGTVQGKIKNLQLDVVVRTIQGKMDKILTHYSIQMARTYYCML